MVLGSSNWVVIGGKDGDTEDGGGVIGWRLDIYPFVGEYVFGVMVRACLIDAYMTRFDSMNWMGWDC